MDYFQLQTTNIFLDNIGKNYDKDHAATQWYLDARKKLKHLIYLLSQDLNIKLINNYNEKPNRQAGRGKPFTLKSYILAGFVPSQFARLKKQVFIKLSFFPDKNGPSLIFGVDVDVNFSDNKNPYNKDRDMLQKETSWTIPVDKNFPSDWNSLLRVIAPIVNDRIVYFEGFFTKDNKEENQLKDVFPSYNNPPMMSIPVNQILFGPPGTGKTYRTVEAAVQIAHQSFDLNQNRDIVKAEYERLVEAGQIVFTTFHQSTSYEDFIEGIKPFTTAENEVIYQIEDGVFKKLCTKATEKEIREDNFQAAYQRLLTEIDQSPDNKLILETVVHAKEFSIYKNSRNNIRFHANTEKAYEGVIKKEVLEHYLKTGETLDWPSYVKAVGSYLKDKYHYTQSEEDVEKNYVLIIDEINRGNVSQIFGELITLIEEDKRLGKDEALTAILPYSKTKFGVPPNLYIIGTMNTADRSVEALDTALRRRFCFKEMPPIPALISEFGKLKDGWGIINGIDLAVLLTKINARIEKLLDKDHLIGHSFFMQVDTMDKLKEAFQNKIIPLLQEYFYGDFGKIELVLGAGFVKEKNTENVGRLFAKSRYDTSSLEDKPVYELVDYTKEVDYDLDIDAVATRMDFETALKLLM